MRRGWGAPTLRRADRFRQRLAQWVRPGCGDGGKDMVGGQRGGAGRGGPGSVPRPLSPQPWSIQDTVGGGQRGASHCTSLSPGGPPSTYQDALLPGRPGSEARWIRGGRWNRPSGSPGMPRRGLSGVWTGNIGLVFRKLLTRPLLKFTHHEKPDERTPFCTTAPSLFCPQQEQTRWPSRAVCQPRDRPQLELWVG